jgi:hypothetical protein
MGLRSPRSDSGVFGGMYPVARCMFSDALAGTAAPAAKPGFAKSDTRHGIRAIRKETQQETPCRAGGYPEKARHPIIARHDGPSPADLGQPNAPHALPVGERFPQHQYSILILRFS